MLNRRCDAQVINGGGDLLSIKLDSSILLGQIAGTEWFILIILGLALLLGPGKLSQFSRALGKVAGEYERGRQSMRREFEEAYEPMKASNFPFVKGAVGTEREKLELIARSLDISYRGMTDDQLRSVISDRMRN